MVRNFGRGIVAALLVAAGCEDTSMNLLQPPPSPAAGSGGSTMAGMAGRTLGGDGGSGGSAANAGNRSGGTGGFGAGQPCPPGAYPPGTPCCGDDSDCKGTGLPYCSYGRCVECTPERDNQPQRGCATNEVCDSNFNYCIPHCSTDDDCGDQGHCDPTREVCVQCTSNDHCKGTSSRRKVCQTQSGTCVECTASSDCDPARHICGMSPGIFYQCVECTSSADCNADPLRNLCSTSDSTDPLHNQCVECTRDNDKACEDKCQLCYEASGRCVDCVLSSDCKDPSAPVCRPDGRCDACVTDQECGGGQYGPCKGGRCLGRPQDPQP